MPQHSLRSDSAQATDALSFVPFTDPQNGTFTVEVPRGWTVRGGFHHPAPGDRRMFVEVQSPDGIVVLFGDPSSPQSLCHVLMAPEGEYVPASTGCNFLNLPPSGQRLAGYYLERIAPQRFGPVKVLGGRERSDLAEAAQNAARQRGMFAAWTLRSSAWEFRIEAAGRAGWCLGVSQCDLSQSLGFMTHWDGNVVVALAPPGLLAVAEQVAGRIIATFRPTAALMRIYHDDERIIASNGAAANMAQVQWFAGQQAAYRAQQSAGDAIIEGYNQRQRDHDRWQHQQSAADDRSGDLSQRWSDAMLGRQRLEDDATGRAYDAPQGANHYWLDPQSGQVLGTETDAPPDYATGYTALRRR